MEQFDQLLTCAICLDRYRNPKLLPCQHSFCMEPCMEGLVNYVTRQVKCPECRAEHRIPYQGIQQYPTNVTLQRFLELHIEITGELPDPTSGQTMERCGVCSEKNYVTPCSHCDKRVCSSCKEVHLDILRREIARVTNQVKRTLPRLQDALGVIEKNTVLLQTNCNNIIEEVDDIYNRLSRSLKERMEGIKTEVEVFMAKEHRHLTLLKDNLDNEVTNFESNLEFADKHMGEGAAWDDNELMDAKDIFLRTMEFIRGFECEPGDYHRRVRFFVPQDPNQLANTLATLGELTINATSSASGSGNQPPQAPTLSSGLMRSKSDHRVAAQFRQAEERYMQSYGTTVDSSDDTTRRYFGDRSSSRYVGSTSDSRRAGGGGGDYGDYDSDLPSTDSSRKSRFRSRFMRHLDSGDSDNEPSSRSVRFHEQSNDSSTGHAVAEKKKERVRVLDTEDATRGPLSGITRLTDSPRVIKRMQEMEHKDKKKDRPTALALPTPTPTSAPAPAPAAANPGRRAARQVSEEDEISKIKKQNKSLESQQSASASGDNSASGMRKTSTDNSHPATPTSGERPRTSPSVSRQTSSTSEKREEASNSSAASSGAFETDDSKRKRSAYLRSQSQQSEPATRAETTAGSHRSSVAAMGSTQPISEESTASRRISQSQGTAAATGAGVRRTPSNSSLNQTADDASSTTSRSSRVTDRFKPARSSASSDSSTSAESSRHSSPVRNTGAAFSTEDIKNRFMGRKSSSSPNGPPPEVTPTPTPPPPAAATAGTRSRFGTVTTSTPASSSSTAYSRYGSSATATAAAASSSTAAASSVASSAANGTAPHRFQSRFLGRAGTPTAEASRGSENSSSSSSSSSSEDSSQSESDSEDNESATVKANPPATNSAPARGATVKERELARTDIGPLLARSAQARTDTTTSYSSRSSAAAERTVDPPSATSSVSSYTRSRPNPPSAPPPASNYSSASSMSKAPVTSRYGGTSSGDHPAPSSSAVSRYSSSSEYSSTPSASLARSRTGSALHSDDMEHKYPLTSKYLNRSRANLGEHGGPSAASASETSSSYSSASPRYGGYKSRFLNKSKSSAALAPDQDGGEDEADSESPSQDGTRENSPPAEGVASAASSKSSAPASGSRYPSGRSRYAALKDRRSRLARSKSSHEVPVNGDIDQKQPSDGQSAKNTGSQHSGEVVDTSTPSLHQQSVEPADTDTGSSLSNWARYLKNKYGPRNKDSDVSDMESGQSRPLARKKSLTGFSTLSPEGNALNKDTNLLMNPASPTTLANFSFNLYMQKRKVQIKFGCRGSDAGHFTWPRGVAVGLDNNVVVADSSNHRIQIFDSKGHFVKEFGRYGNSEGEFDCLAGVAVNRIGQFIVADRYNHRIQVFDPSGRFLRSFGSQGSTDGKFSYPWGITTDALGFIYVCDKENHRVQVFQSDGTFVGKFGSLGNKPGQLEHPHYIAVSCTNRVIVSDSNNHRVQVFDVNGKLLSSFGQEGADDGQLKFPRGVTVDDQGYIIVADSGNNRIQIFNPDGKFVRSFGCWGSGDGEFKGLEGIAVLSNGNIAVCDRENHRIQIF